MSMWPWFVYAAYFGLHFVSKYYKTTYGLLWVAGTVCAFMGLALLKLTIVLKGDL